MLGQKPRLFKQHTTISLEELVPRDNFYRDVEAKLDLTFVRTFVQAQYASVMGRPSIDPVVFFNLKTNDFREPIRRGQAWKFITGICNEVGLRGNFGTHSFRKTRGYHARLSGVDLALIMHKLNHNSLTYT